MKIWKVVLIVIFSVIGAAGIIMLGVYLSGGFTPKESFPEDAFFANVTTVDNVDTYTARGSTPYDVYENFELIVGTTTEEVNKTDVELSFPTNQTGSIVKYLKQVGLTETFAGNINNYYAKQDDEKVLRFISCGEEQATFVTNGVVIVPVKTTLNKSFTAYVCVAPENVKGDITVEVNEETGEEVILTPLYNVGGYAQIIARSENLEISSSSAYVNVDVPVENIDIIGITGENLISGNISGLNEYSLTDANDNGQCDVGTEGQFSVVLDVTPARAVYKYGKNGDFGSVEYKRVIFSINSDENLIAFAGDNNAAISTKIIDGSKYIYNEPVALKDLFGADFVASNYNYELSNWQTSYQNVLNSVSIKNDELVVSIKNSAINSYFELTVTATLKTNTTTKLTATIYGNDSSLKNGEGIKTTTLGTKFISHSSVGASQIHAGIFKTALLENQILATTTTLSDLFVAMSNDAYGLTKTSTFDIKEIAIDGFEVVDTEEQQYSINDTIKLYANNAEAEYNLGIEISSNSNGIAQNKIRNVLVSLQYTINGTEWYDATQRNGAIGALFVLRENNEVVTGSALRIASTHDLYSFQFFRPIYTSASNMSYWEISATSETEKIDGYGITALRIFAYYLSPDDGLMLDDEANYGPYNIDLVVEQPVETNVAWNNVDNITTNVVLGAGNYNNRVLLNDREEIPLNAIANITNLNQNPAYTEIRYFIYSDVENLDSMFNVTRYYGLINGIDSSAKIYEVDLLAEKLICTSLGALESIEFNLIFAVVEHLPNGSAVMYMEGGHQIYRIITLPKQNNESIIYAPFKIQKTLGAITTAFNEATGTVLPYGESEDTYFLQSTERNISYSISIDESDEQLFIDLARSGDLVLSAKYFTLAGEVSGACNDIYLHYVIGEQTYNIALADVLSTMFASQEAITRFTTNPSAGDPVMLRTEQGTKVVFTFKFSTKDIPFEGSEDEKRARIDLDYTISADNIPASYTNPRVVSTDNFCIYSGKVKDIGFGTEENPIAGTINVTKTVDGNEFSTTYTQDGNNIALYEVGTNNILVYVEGFEINDGYTVISSDQTVIQAIYNNGKYIINFLKTGQATLTLRPTYKHSTTQDVVLAFNVTSDYTLSQKSGIDVYDESGEGDSRVVSYNNMGYTIIGKTGADIMNFASFIKVTAVVGEDSADITNKFAFAVAGETLAIRTAENPSGKIELIGEVGAWTGLKVVSDLGKRITLYVTASSNELGATYVFTISIDPSMKITTALISDQAGATKPANASAESIAVFAENKIDIVGYQYQEYNFDTNPTKYDSTTIPALNYSIYNIAGERLALTTVSAEYSAPSAELRDDYGNIIATLYLDPASRALTGIKFSAVGENETKFILVVRIAESGDGDYDLKKEFVFYVSPNIQLETEGFAGAINGSTILLNNQENPVKNKDNISVVANLDTETGVYNSLTVFIGGEEINFKRILGGDALLGELKINNEPYNDPIEILGVQSLSEQTLTLSYGDYEFTIKYWANPNIEALDEKTVVYDGKSYVSFYAGQDVSNVKSWFTVDGFAQEGLVVSLGQISLNGSIKSLPKLYALNEQINITEGINYGIVKNADGLIETTIIVSYGTGADRQFIALKALIFPLEWEYVNYTSAETDVKTLLSSEMKESVESNESYTVSSDFIGEAFRATFNSYINLNYISYKLYETTNGMNVLVGNSTVAPVYLAKVSDMLTLITQPIGGNRTYRIEFTYTRTAEGYAPAVYIFNYYVEVTGTQTINIYYPEKNTATQLGENLENGSVKEDFEIAQNIYYDLFSDGEYVINLNSKSYNFQNKNFAELMVGDTLVAQGASVPAYNKLKFEIYKAFDFSTGSARQLSSDLSNFVEITENGLLTLKNYNNTTLKVIIKISTPNGAVNYYNVVAQTRQGNAVEVVYDNYDLATSTIEMSAGSQISIDDILAGGLNGREFVIIDGNGEVCDSNDMIYVNDSLAIVAKTVANVQKATLIVYTEETGILAKIEIQANSAMVVEERLSTTTIYGDGSIDDGSIDIDDYITIVGMANKGALSYQLEFVGDYADYISYTDGSTFKIYPLNQARTFTVIVKFTGGNLGIDNGGIWTDAANTCIKEITFTVQPNIITQNAYGEIFGGENKTIENMYSLQSGGDLTDYKYSADLLWDGGIGESIGIGVINTLTLTGSTLSTLNATLLTMVSSNVTAIRTATLTIRVYKVNDGGSKIGDEFVATYTLYIYPQILIDVKYPDYSSSGTFNSEYLYTQDAGVSVDLSARLEYWVNTEAQTGTSGLPDGYESIPGTYTAQKGEDEYYKVLVREKETNTYSIMWYKKEIGDVGATYVSDDERLTVSDDVVTISSGVSVNQDTQVVIKILVGELVCGSYNIVISPNPVFTATVRTGVEEIVDTDMEPNVFAEDYYGFSASNSRVTYYYRGHEIPYAVAQTLLYVKNGNVKTKLDEFEISSDHITTSVPLYNQFDTLVGVYACKVVYDYSIPSSNIDTITIENGVTSSERAWEYVENENGNIVESFANRDLVLKTIELTAGTAYSLSSILTGSTIGMKKYYSEPFVINDAEFAITLEYGSYTTNSGFAGNISGLIGIAKDASTKEWTITPNGAQNGGDIVHLRLRFGNVGDSVEYVLRIKIMPNVSIYSTTQNGELTTNSADGGIDYSFANFVTTENITADKLMIAVLGGSDGQFVIGEGSNKAQKFASGTGLNQYGIKLKKTVLGGAKIKFKIFDEYGYSATDANGDPITFTLYYQNAEGSSPQISSADTTTGIFEAKTFNVFYTNAQGTINKYNGSTDKWGNPGTGIGDLETRIMLNGNLAGTTIEILGNTTTNSYLSNVMNGLNVNYLPNAAYESSNRIIGQTLFVRISLNNTSTGIIETCILPLNIAIKQRYSIKEKDLYGNYAELYLSNGVGYPVNDLFEVIDNEAGSVDTGISISASGLSEMDGDYLTLTGGVITASCAPISELTTRGQQRVLSYQLTGGNAPGPAITYKYTINYYLTPTYCQLDSSGVSVYNSTLGRVVVGTGASTLVTYEQWATGYKVKDWYGQVSQDMDLSDVSYTIINGTGTLDENTKNIGGMVAGGSVQIAVKSDNVQIGTITVTLSRYSSLRASGEQLVNVVDSTLPFSITGTGNGWGEGVEALVTGSENVYEQITGGLSGGFTYSIADGTSPARIEYSESYGCYVITNLGELSSIGIDVVYMGINVGTVALSKTDNIWRSVVS